MSNDLEKELRDALRHVDPAEGFTQRVMARIEAGESRSKRWLPLQVRWLPVALAASAIFGAVAMHAWHERQQRQGLEARQQLIEALRVTGEKLDLAYRVVNAESEPARSEDTGA